MTHSSKGPLFEENISLLCYPPEFIFAEKLETLVNRGGINSRMKDFHDLHTMLNMGDLSFDKLKTIISSVFAHRKTPFALPLTFADADISMLQSHWARYHTRLTQNISQTLPLNIAELIVFINQFLEKIVNNQ